MANNKFNILISVLNIAVLIIGKHLAVPLRLFQIDFILDNCCNYARNPIVRIFH